jgi:serine/threonine protein kinase
VTGSPNVPASESREICTTFREIITQIYCQHPAVIQFHGWNYCAPKEEKPAYIVLVTSWTDGGTLAGRLSTKKKTVPHADQLPDTERNRDVSACYGIARALALAHSHRGIHRDVKPENVFLNSKKHPRMADLGLAKMLQQGIDMSGGGGAKLYMAPEAIPEDVEWSFSADVCAYGIMFWKLL